MNKAPKTFILAISIALVGIVWIVAAGVCTAALKLPFLSWDGIAGVVMAMIAAELYLLVFRKNPGEGGTETAALGIIFTVGYFLTAVLMNSVFVLLALGGFSLLFLILNLAVLVCYIMLLLWAEQQTARLGRQMAKTEEKTAPTREIARKLGQLLAICDDPEIKSSLLKLKEAVDYATNISTDATATYDDQMNTLLDEIVQLALGNADRMIMLNKVSSAQKLWKMRSGAASSRR